MKNLVTIFHLSFGYNVGEPLVRIKSKKGFGFSLDHIETLDESGFKSMIGNPYENNGYGWI